MNIIRRTDEFDSWLKSLDHVIRAKIIVRIERAMLGNFGDCRSVGGGVFEMRVSYGPGFRLYYAQEGSTSYLLLVGGDKSTQQTDICRAKQMWATLKS